MSLAKRIKDLEAAMGIGRPGCPECGGGGGGPVRVIFAGAIGPNEEFEEKHCEECGRPLNFTLRLGETDLPHRGETEEVFDE